MHHFPFDEQYLISLALPSCALKDERERKINAHVCLGSGSDSEVVYIYIYIFLFRDTIIESNAFGDPYSVIVLGCTLPKLLKTHQDVSWPSKLVAVPFCTNKSIPFNLEGV